MKQESFVEVVERIYNIPLITKKNEMKDTKSFLAKMGNPDSNMKIIHVAGTNGKGSTCAYLSALLQKAGYRVGMFTSPHLVDIRERFLVNDVMISEEGFIEGVREIDSMLRDTDYNPSYFEYLFFVGMQFFKKKQVDFLLLETGLGGRLDATNAIEHKVLSIITRIALDHTQYLGDTIEKIAFEKAGIIKENVPLVFLEQENIVNNVLEQTAKKAAAPIEKARFLEENDTVIREKCVAFYAGYRYYKREEFVLSTKAVYQVDNARLAILAMETMVKLGIVEKDLEIEQLQEALFKTNWAGRMEEVLPGIYLDGAHNLNGVNAFMESVNTIACEGKRILIFSAVDDKDYHGMLARIQKDGIFEVIIVTQVDNKRRVSVDKFEQISRAVGVGASIKTSIDFIEAIEIAFLERQTQDHIFIAGSLYLIGEAKSYFMYNKILK